MVAFEGWNDAGDAASGAARWLADRHEAELVATLDAEEYFDFTATRPLIELDETGVRRLTWPDPAVWAATTDGPRDLVVLLGNEPHLRWRTFCREVLDLADALGCSLIVTLGALLSELPHTRPTVVSGTTEDPTLLDRLELTRSSYEGPTGILGVLHAQARADDRPSVSLWASVPTYVSTAPSPKATLALVERALRLLGLSVPTVDLQIASAAYERQIDELVSADEDTAAYVASLEEDADADDERNADARLDVSGDPLEDADPGDLVEQVERFLRGD